MSNLSQITVEQGGGPWDDVPGDALLDLNSKSRGRGQIPASLLPSSSGLAAGTVPLGQIVSVKEARFGAVGDGATDDTAAIEAALAVGDTFVPAGTYRVTRPIRMPSNRRLFGAGVSSIIANDRSAVQVSRWACILLGDSHGAGFAGYTAFPCNASIAGVRRGVVTSGTTTGLAIGDLVYYASATNVSGVPVYGQLTRIESISAGVVGFSDGIEFPISDPVIYKFAGTDTDLNVEYHAISDVQIDNLAFIGRSPFATKSAVYNFTIRNIWLNDCFIGVGLNTATHGLIENVYGKASNRALEMALNSYDVTIKNYKLVWKPVSALTGEDTQGTPIVIGEQSTRIVLDQVNYCAPPEFTLNSEVASIKGLGVELINCHMTHGGSSGGDVLVVASGNYNGYPPQNINIRGGKYEVAVSKARVMNIGGSATNAPIAVRFHAGVELRGPTSSRSVWFQHGTGHEVLSMSDYCDKGHVVSSTCGYPVLSGYRRF